MSSIANQTSNSQIFKIFFILGCIAFGGPVAHLVLFRQKFVTELSWLTDQEFSQLLAYTQILPGPTSSQVGIAIGYLKRGYLGGCMAWLGFTLPAFIIMTILAYLGANVVDRLDGNFFHGIHLIVLSVVGWAFWQMMQNFCKETWQYLLMLSAAFFLYLFPHPANQIVLIIVAAFSGNLITLAYPNQHSKFSLQNTNLEHTFKNSLTQQKVKPWIWLLLFTLPLLSYLMLNQTSENIVIQSFNSLYYSASLVFGGGHIILPLMHEQFVNTQLISSAQFDLGYAAVQLVPGPLFSFASYIGAFLNFTDSKLINAIIATVAIFLPSFFLIFGTLPYWSKLMSNTIIQRAMPAINAAIIGLLLVLVIQMGQSYLLNLIDCLTVIATILLLSTRMPVWLSLAVIFTSYFSISHYLVAF